MKEGAPAEEGRGSEVIRPRVLVIDDSEDSRELFTTALALAGYAVEMADSAAVGLEAARREKFDLIISDIGMPRMSGYELAKALRSIPEYRAVPMIAVTGFVEFSDRHTAVWAGFDEHLAKPVEPAKLCEVVARLLGAGGIRASDRR